MISPTPKPVYRVPSMREIDALPRNGIKVASTFSGGGGSSLGYKMAGCEVVYANEFVEEAQKTYRANFPKTHLDTRDIRTIKPEEILSVTGLKPGELDIFDGSPPCCSFSLSGSREKQWGKDKSYSNGKVQKTDDLFFEYLRIMKGLRPKVFVAENVKGLVVGKAKGYFLIILEALKACGYRVRAKVLNAGYLGVPQMRQRLIFIGVREDLKQEPVFPEPMPYCINVGEALQNLNVKQNSSVYLKRAKHWILSAAFRKTPARFAAGIT